MTISMPKRRVPKKKRQHTTFHGRIVEGVMEIPYIESNLQVRLFNLTQRTHVESWSIQTNAQQTHNDAQRNAKIVLELDSKDSEDVSMLMLPAKFMNKINQDGLASALTEGDERMRTFAAFVQAMKRHAEDPNDDEPPF